MGFPHLSVSSMHQLMGGSDSYAVNTHSVSDVINTPGEIELWSANHPVRSKRMQAWSHQREERHLLDAYFIVPCQNKVIKVQCTARDRDIFGGHKGKSGRDWRHRRGWHLVVEREKDHRQNFFRGCFCSLMILVKFVHRHRYRHSSPVKTPNWSIMKCWCPLEFLELRRVAGQVGYG